MNTPNPFTHARTVFFTVGSQAALLVTNSCGRLRKKPLQFADAHKALTWCLEKRAAFVCLPAEPPATGRN